MDKISDHDSFLVELDKKADKPTDIPLIKTKCFNYDKCDFDGLREELLKINTKFKNFMDKKFPSSHKRSIPESKLKRLKKARLDKGVKLLEELLLEAFCTFVPYKTRQYSADQEFNTLFPLHLQNQINRKNRTWNKLRKKGKNPNTETEFLNLQRECKRRIKDFKSKWIEELDTNKFGNERSFYAKMDSLLERQSSKGLIRIEKTANF